MGRPVSVAKRFRQARYLVSCVVMATLASAPVVTALLYSPNAGQFMVRAKRVVLPVHSPGAYARSQAVLTAAVSPIGETTPAGTSSARPLGRVSSWRRFILQAWALGVVVFAFRLMWSWGHTSALRRKCIDAEAAVAGAVSQVAERICITRQVRVALSAVADIPSVVGSMKPLLLLPVSDRFRFES